MKKLSNKYLKTLFPSFVILFLCVVLIIWANKALTVRDFEIKSEKIPSDFDGFCIAHVSDLHNTSFGKENKKLFDKLKLINPDIIAVTGDVIDSRRTNIKIATDFFEKAVEIAPVYYVTGNHEVRTASYKKLEDAMKKLGVIIADNATFTILQNGKTINLCGIADPSALAKYDPEIEDGVVSFLLEGLHKKDGFNILLSHRPEFFDIYVNKDFDLVLSGHAHGGQFRLPFIGGLLAPGQGLFPKYDSGIYQKENTSMIVSRGLGNSVFPFRLFNRPEVISVTLKNS